MMNFNHDEINLMCIYDTGSRTGLMNALSEMRKELNKEEAELCELTDSTLNKLSVCPMRTMKSWSCIPILMM